MIKSHNLELYMQQKHHSGIKGKSKHSQMKENEENLLPETWKNGQRKFCKQKGNDKKKEKGILKHQAERKNNVNI